VGIVVVFWGLFIGYSARFDQFEIQQRLDDRLPTVNQQLADSGNDIQIERLEVFINDTLTIATTANGSRLGKSFRVSATATGTPIYAPFKSQFFFDPNDISIDSLQFDGTSIADTLAGAAKRYITNTGLQLLVTDNADKLELWVTNATETTVTRVLERMPIYTLKREGNELLAIAFLDDLYIENGEVVVHLTLMRLMWWTFMAIAAVVMSLGFMIALMRNPGLGSAALIFSSFDT
jgi:hypothetical protein